MSTEKMIKMLQDLGLDAEKIPGKPGHVRLKGHLIPLNAQAVETIRNGYYGRLGKRPKLHKDSTLRSPQEMDKLLNQALA